MRYTPTEQRMLAILADGKFHHWRELQRCLNDDLCGKGVVITHLSHIRRKLLTMGGSLICSRTEEPQYKHIPPNLQ